LSKRKNFEKEVIGQQNLAKIHQKLIKKRQKISSENTEKPQK